MEARDSPGLDGVCPFFLSRCPVQLGGPLWPPPGKWLIDWLLHATRLRYPPMQPCLLQVLELIRWSSRSETIWPSPGTRCESASTDGSDASVRACVRVCLQGQNKGKQGRRARDFHDCFGGLRSCCAGFSLAGWPHIRNSPQRTLYRSLTTIAFSLFFSRRHRCQRRAVLNQQAPKREPCLSSAHHSARPALGVS